MANYDFTENLSPLDFELLSKDLLEAELGIQLENFKEGRDKGIDLRYAPIRGASNTVFNLANFTVTQQQPTLIVQCKRYGAFPNLKSELKNSELEKIIRLKPARYILITSVSLSPQQADELKNLLSPFIQSTGDIYGRERLNSILAKHNEIERRHIKLWITSTGVLDAILNGGTHVISQEEVARTISAAKLYVRNTSFDEALAILKQHRVCIISGLPGIGKTTLARMLLLYFYERKFDIVKVGGDISEARNVSYHSKPRFYYYDDFLGQTAQADKLNKNEDQRLLDFMAAVRESKDSVFVLTTREYILNQAKLHYEKLDRERFNHRTCIIDLSKYSRRIRAQILYNHLHFSRLPRTHLTSLVLGRGYTRIIDHPNYNPRLIEYLTDLAWVGEIAPEKYLSHFLQKLANPVQIWEHAFRNQLSSRARDLLYVITTMPTETRIGDAENAFHSFHHAQCKKFGLPRSVDDFQTALKELDGTFIGTRRIDDTVLVSFQNPSIRDFMQYLLSGGVLLPEIIECLVFFEQAQWLIETLSDEEAQVSRLAFEKNNVQILEAARNLINAKGCSILINGSLGHHQWITLPSINAADRIKIIALAHFTQGIPMDYGWMDEKIGKLADYLKEGSISTSAVLSSIDEFKKLGLIHSSTGNRLRTALKESATSTPTDLDDYERLAEVFNVLPELFSEIELEDIRGAYSAYIEHHITQFDVDDPEELRNEASRIDAIGDLLGVNTDDIQGKLRGSADEIEAEQEARWDDDNDRGSGRPSEECSDGELDSMFGTLRQ